MLKSNQTIVKCLFIINILAIGHKNLAFLDFSYFIDRISSIKNFLLLRMSFFNFILPIIL